MVFVSLIFLDTVIRQFNNYYSGVSSLYILGKESILTEENSPEYPLVTVKSDGELIVNGAC